jgi:16S rRNA (uracil1498-N3)-methyltransferase
VVHAPLLLNDWLEQCHADMKLVLSPHVTNKLKDVAVKPASIAVLIGPEGGLSEREIETTIKYHFTALNLGPRILRTETAAIAALSVLQFQFGDFN